MELSTNNTIFTFSTKEHKIYFTSDTHFWHENIIKYTNRPFSSVEEMNETIINNWNNIVKENDIVFHLGDFGFCGSSKMNDILNKLNGQIYLILGNHDWKTMKQGYIKRFKFVGQQLTIRIDNQLIYLNHFPFLAFAGAWRGLTAAWQLFGHVHSSPVNSTGLDVQRLINLFPTQYDVGVDNNNFTPVSYEKVKEIIKDQQMSLNMHRN